MEEEEEEEAEVDGEETEAGEGTIVGSRTETETETGTLGMAAGINPALQAPTRDTTPIIRDHIMTATDLESLRCFQYSLSFNLHCNPCGNVHLLICLCESHLNILGLI